MAAAIPLGEGRFQSLPIGQAGSLCGRQAWQMPRLASMPPEMNHAGSEPATCFYLASVQGFPRPAAGTTGNTSTLVVSVNVV